MAISHVCLGCGLELARVRAARDPHYGLWIVACPACRTAAVRGRGDLARAYRRWRRLRKSLGGLALQLGLGVGLFLMVSSGVVGIVNEMASMGTTPTGLAAALFGDGPPRVREWALDEGLFGLALWGALCVASGVWLTAGLAHLSRVVWLVWGAAMLVLVNIERVLVPILRAYGDLIGDPFTGHAPPDPVMQSRLVMYAAALVLAAGLGVPIGRLCSGLLTRLRRARTGRYRARTRRLHRGHAA